MTTYNMDLGESKTFAFDVQGVADLTSFKVYIGSKSFDIVDKGNNIFWWQLTPNSAKHFGAHNKISAIIESPTIGVQKIDALFLLDCTPSAMPVNSDATTDIVSVTTIVSVTETAITVDAVVYDYAKGDKGDTGATGLDGDDGLTYIPYQAYASDSNGTGWSLTPSDSLKYSAFIPWLSTNPTPPTSADYAGAKWQLVVGGVTSTDLKATESNLLDYVCSAPLASTDINGLVIWLYNSATDVAGYAIKMHPVVAGRKYRIKGQFTNPVPANAGIGVYCFYSGGNYTSGISGTLVTQQNVSVKLYDVIITAPIGAVNLGVSQLIGVDDIKITELIYQAEVEPRMDAVESGLTANKARSEKNFDLLSAAITPVYRDGYVIPYYLWEEADVNYKVAKYPVRVGQKYRLRAQVTAKAVAQGTMGAYCFYKELSVPLTGGITTLPQLSTVIYDVELTIPPETTYLCVSQKLIGGDYNSLSEIIASNTLKTKIEEIVSENITCDGDSITWGAAPEDGKYWTMLLQQLVGTSKKIINCGVGGESAVNIPARQGAMPMYNSLDFTLPADTSLVPVGRYDGWFYDGFFRSTYDDAYCSFLLQGEGRDFNTINPCFVDGIECTLSYVSENTNPTTGQYYIKRNQADTARTIKAGTVVHTNAAKTLKRHASIVFMGTNDGWVDVPDLIARHKKMIDFANVGKNYIVIGIYGGTAKTNHALDKAAFEQMEKAFAKEFGLHYINLRYYTVTNALSDAGITPTQADTDAIALGDCPPSLLADSVHPNAAFSVLISKLVYEKMKSLGIV